MEETEFIEEAVDGSTVKVRKIDWTYYKKKDLDAMKMRMEAELAKVNALLEKF